MLQCYKFKILKFVITKHMHINTTDILIQLRTATKDNNYTYRNCTNTYTKLNLKNSLCKIHWSNYRGPSLFPRDLIYI